MKEDRGLRVLVALRYRLHRAAFCSALSGRPGIGMVAQADGIAASMASVQRLRPDVLLVDDRLVGDAADWSILKQAPAPARILVLADRADHATLLAAVQRGADGFATQHMSLEEVISAVERVGRGETFVPPGMLGELLNGLASHRRSVAEAQGRYARLTSREQQVLGLLADGCDHTVVAEELAISPQTARTHIQNVMQKLGVHSRLEAAVLTHEYGLIERRPVPGELLGDGVGARSRG